MLTEVKIVPNHTYIDGSEHRISNVAVGDKEDGLDEAKEEKLEGVDLANEDSKGDQNCRSTETSFQHSSNQIVNVMRVNMMIILSSSILFLKYPYNCSPWEVCLHLSSFLLALAWVWYYHTGWVQIRGWEGCRRQ